MITMGFFTKLAESMSTGANATMSMRGIMGSFNHDTGLGTVKYAGKTYKIKIKSKDLKDLFEVFPYNVPEEGMDVLFNVDSSKTYAIQVMPADPRRRGLNCRDIVNKM